MTLTPPGADGPLTWDQRFQVILAVVIGIAFIVLPFIWAPPSTHDLVPVEGPLVSYSLFRTQSRSPDLLALIALGGHQGRFWNDALKNGTARQLEGKTGVRVRVMYDPKSRLRPEAGDAVKSYGLWVDGVELAPAESALGTDRFLAFVFIPGMGLLMIGFGYRRFRKFSRAGDQTSD